MRPPTAVIALLVLLAVPVPAVAATGTVRCGAAHFLRPQPDRKELATAFFSFRNFNPDHAVTIDRLTIRNRLGQVVHDSGPAIGTPHPKVTIIDALATFALDNKILGDLDPRDITVVPPGANFSLQTDDIWGRARISTGPLAEAPDAVRNQQGLQMSATIEFSTEGKKELFVVTAIQRIEAFDEKDPPGIRRPEHSRNSFRCDLE